MRDFKLSKDTHDLVLGNGDLSFVDEKEEIAQSIKVRLLFIRGEWILDLQLGVQMYDVLFNTRVSKALKEQLIKNIILQTDGVTGVASFNFDVDSTTKKATVTFEVNTVYGVTTGSTII